MNKLDTKLVPTSCVSQDKHAVDAQDTDPEQPDPKLALQQPSMTSMSTRLPTPFASPAEQKDHSSSEDR